MANYKEGREANDQANEIDIGKKRTVAYFFADKIGSDGGDKVVSKHFFTQLLQRVFKFLG